MCFFELGKTLSFSGFVDFEPSMIGAPEYDFAAVGIFLSSGNPNALRSFLGLRKPRIGRSQIQEAHHGLCALAQIQQFEVAS